MVTSAGRGPAGLCFVLAGRVVYLSGLGAALVATVRMDGFPCSSAPCACCGTTEGTTAPGAIFSAATMRTCSRFASFCCFRIIRRR